ncbi:site-2 protease family protein [bacterium]|nr:site-2 protease family protein [bacterium]RQV93269.1 MAG: site-2 protease family protein [bacterium]
MINSIPQFVILVFSIVFHEVAHGRVALWRGDTTARDAGRLTLNPIPHIDLFGTIIFPLFLVLTRSPFLFGWAKPVPVNPWRLRESKKDMAIVGASGPVSNFLLALIGSVLFRISFQSFGFEHSLTQAFLFAVDINVVLAVFNLIPIPPLDGSRVVTALLPTDLAIRYNRLERYGFLIIFALFFLNILQFILWPIVYFFRSLILGVSPF